jgi:DNA mismatch repair protein MutS
MTLYGVNACGKSSYLKATGLSVIMAQAGLYVPADTFIYKPFTRIMTRIAGGDSIEKGQSSFVVELLDLGSVISRADEDTLVLGDEMCRGTEIASAEALVHTTLATLVEKGTLFVTATHLHGIAQDIGQLQGVDIFHMEVAFDEDGDPIYDRKLRSGPGAEYYGLEIARAQGFPTEFMKRAMEYRNRKAGTKTVEGKRSRYNSKKILVACEACQYRPVRESDLPLDTHHVNFQCHADKDGFHGTQSKDAAHNLICLCKQCHIDVHKGTKNLTLLQTLKGRKVVLSA